MPFVQRLEQVAAKLDCGPSMPAVAEKMARSLLWAFPDKSEAIEHKFCCRLCGESRPTLSDLKEHIVLLHLHGGGDQDRAFVEHRKKVLALAELAGPQARACKRGSFCFVSSEGESIHELVLFESFRAKMIGLQVPGMNRQRAIAASFDERLRCPPGMAKGRRESACVVCARRFWENELCSMVLFQSPDAGPDDLTLPPGAETIMPSQQVRLCRLLGVKRYMDRWPHIASTEEGKNELMASTVEHPYLPGNHLLLHRRRMPAQSPDPCHVCKDCRASLRTPVLSLPRYALANDLHVDGSPAARIAELVARHSSAAAVGACLHAGYSAAAIGASSGGTAEGLHWQHHLLATS